MNSGLMPEPSDSEVDRTTGLRMSGVEFRYAEGDFRLRIEELSVSAGECVAVIGPSGSGKTTLLHLAAGILQPVRGSISAGGQEVTRLSDAARRRFRVSRVGLVFQEFELLEYLNVSDNILLPFRINPRMRLTREVRARVRELSDAMGIEKHLNRYVNRLSQGERQRVGICRALVTEPALVLADEPTGNLDPVNTIRTLELMLDRVRSIDAALLMVTHDHSLLDRFDRVIDLAGLQAAGAAGTQPQLGVKASSPEVRGI